MMTIVAVRALRVAATHHVSGTERPIRPRAIADWGARLVGWLENLDGWIQHRLDQLEAAEVRAAAWTEKQTRIEKNINAATHALASRPAELTTRGPLVVQYEERLRAVTDNFRDRVELELAERGRVLGEQAAALGERVTALEKRLADALDVGAVKTEATIANLDQALVSFRFEGGRFQ